jgi:hypothetical protein
MNSQATNFIPHTEPMPRDPPGADNARPTDEEFDELVAEMQRSIGKEPTVEALGDADRPGLAGSGGRAIGHIGLDGLVARGSKLFRQQRQRMDEAARQYQFDRLALVDRFRQRLVALQNEADDALRDFDREHDRAVAEGKRVLTALAALGDG